MHQGHRQDEHSYSCNPGGCTNQRPTVHPRTAHLKLRVLVESHRSLTTVLNRLRSVVCDRFPVRTGSSPNTVSNRFPFPVPVNGGTWRLGNLGNVGEPVDLLIKRIEYGPELHLSNLGEHPDVFDVLE